MTRLRPCPLRCIDLLLERDNHSALRRVWGQAVDVLGSRLGLSTGRTSPGDLRKRLLRGTAKTNYFNFVNRTYSSSARGLSYPRPESLDADSHDDQNTRNRQTASQD